MGKKEKTKEKTPASSRSAGAMPRLTKSKSKRMDSPASPSKATENGGKKVGRINVNFEDEVIFVLDKIDESKLDNVLITIPSGSDLLVSTVSLELLAEAADRKGKNIVVVTDDEVGRSVVRRAGITVGSTVSSVDDDVWKEAEKAGDVRKDEIEKRRNEAKEHDENELVPVYSDMGDISDVPVETADIKTAPTMGSPVSGGVEDGAMASQISGVKKVKVGGLEMTVDSSPMDKEQSPEEMSDQIRPEIKKSKIKKGDKGGYIGKDFSNFELLGLDKQEKEKMKSDVKLPKKETPKANKPIVSPLVPRRKKRIDFSAIKALFTGPKKKKLFIILGIVLFLLLTGGVMGASRYLPEVTVTLEVDSISVEYEGEIIGDIGEDGIDEDDLIIPAKVEEVEKNGSDTANTTGTEERGEKATGAVLVFNKTSEEEIVLNAGTVITNGGLNFVMQKSVVLDPVSLTNPATMGEADIVAQKIGDGYNAVSGTQFSVGDYNLADVYATNTEAFVGGSAEEYKIVNQSDIDGLVENIHETLNTEAEAELEGKTDNSRWVLVTESIEHDLVGDAKASAPAGAEANTIDVSIETISKAIYYDINKLDELVEALLLEDFEGQVEDIELSENVEKNISIKSYDLIEGTVTLEVSVDGFVMPQLNDDQIKSSLAGKSWSDGIRYLEDMDYVSEDYDLDFSPEWVPEILWRMPNSEDRITVKVSNITPEDEEESEEGEDSSESSE